jgi:hypothetical protein
MCPVAVKVAGLPVMPVPVAVAVRLLAPATGPRVQDVTAATPFTSVAIGVVGFTVPPPLATAKVTPTPATGFPSVSVTLTAGGTATGAPADPF